MKYFLLFLMSFIPNLEADILGLEKLSARVERVHNIWKQNGNIQDVDSSELDGLRIELYGNRPNVWNMNPKQLEKLRENIEPLRDLALQLRKSENEHQRYHAASLLAYLEPTNATQSALVDLANDVSSSTAATALDTVFGMRWDTPELRQDIVRQLENKLQGKSYRGLAFTGAGKWGITEAIPVLMKILEKAYLDQNFKGKSALRQFRYLGTSAVEVLPLLERILAEQKAEGGIDFREIEALEHTIYAVKNGGIRQQSWRGLEPSNRNQKQSNQKSVTTRSNKNSAAEENRPSSQEQSSNLPWIIAGVLLLGILALLFKVFKGKSTS